MCVLKQNVWNQINKHLIGRRLKDVFAPTVKVATEINIEEAIMHLAFIIIKSNKEREGEAERNHLF